jgi:hypothetical protein
MYRAPPPLGDRPLRERLRRLVICYAVLAGFTIGYAIAGMSSALALFDEGGSPLAWLSVIVAFLVLYAPFLRTAGMDLPRWIVHMRRLIIAAAAGLAGFGIVFAFGGVFLPTVSGSSLIVACITVSVSLTLRFLSQRLELL